jgi:hypothetical protein
MSTASSISTPDRAVHRAALRKRKAYRAALGPDGARLAPIEQRRLLNKLKARLSQLSYEDLMAADLALDGVFLDAEEREAAA